MRLQTGLRRVFALIALSVGIIPSSAQGLSSSNPLEYAAIAGGEELLGNQIKKQSKAMAAIAVEQGAMTVANTKMKQWEQKYNSYLKTASGYASRINPQGIAASLSMNNLYLETATEFIRTYRALKNVIAKGGEDNMLNGAERTQMLWNLTNNLERLNRKLRLLSVSVTMHSLDDVWNRAITGKINKSNKVLAKESSKRMCRAISNVAKFYKYRQTHKPWGQ